MPWQGSVATYPALVTLAVVSASREMDRARLLLLVRLGMFVDELSSWAIKDGDLPQELAWARWDMPDWPLIIRGI